MGILYFDVEANYEELIELRKQIAGLEKQMTEVGSQGAAALEPLEKKYAALSARIETLTSQAAINGQKIQSAYSQMGKVSSGINTTTQKTTANAGKVGKVMADGVADADNATQIFNETLGGVNRGLGKTLNMMNGLGSTIGTVFGVGAIGMFLNKVQEVRTYFQDIESSMRVFLGDAEKANKFTNELKSYAYYNMFEFADLAGGAKQLIAYGNETEKIIPIMDKLSNVATGTGASLGELISLYNKAKSTGQVMARDVQSWAAKGVVLRDELKAMGVEASTGAVTFNQLNQVLERVTGEGGRFHNLMAEQMNNLSAAKGQFQDNLDAMYNEIGEKLQPLLKGTIDMASWLVDNYQTVGKTVLALASAYGIYRTVLGVMNSLDEIRLKRLQSSLAAINGEVVATKDTIRSKGEEILARKENIATMEKEIAMKQAALKANRAKYLDEIELIRLDLKKQRDIKKELNDEYDMLLGETNNAQSKSAKKRIERQMASNRKKMADAVQQESVLKGKLKDADDALITNSKQLKAATEAMNDEMQESITLTDMLADTKAALSAKVAPLKAVLSNPYVIMAAAITAAIVLVYKLSEAQMTYGLKAYEETNKQIEAQNELIDRRIERSSAYIRTIKDETKSLKEQRDAYEKLIKIYPSLREKSLSDIKKSDIDKLQADIKNQEEVNRGNMLKNNIDILEKRVKELQADYDKNRGFSATPTGGMVDYAAAEGRALDKAKAELKAYTEAYEGYKEVLKDNQMKALSHEDRMEILNAEKEVADERLNIMNTLYKDFNEIRQSDSETEEQSRAQYIEDINTQQARVQEMIDKTQAEYEEAKKENRENPLLFNAKMEELTTLQAELQKLSENLQATLDDSPLEFAFGDIDLSFQTKDELREAMAKMSSQTAVDSLKGDVMRPMKRAVNKMRREIGDIFDSELSDEEKAGAISKIYDEAIAKIANIGQNADDLGRQAIDAYLDSLETERNNRMNTYLNGGAAVLLGDSSMSASANASDKKNAIDQEMKKYGEYPKRLANAQASYNKALADFIELDTQRAKGASINLEDMKNRKEALKVAEEGYKEVLKEGQRYKAFNNAERKRLRDEARRTQDTLFSIEENEIKIMRDGSSKSIAQTKLDFQKRIEEIKRGYEDLKETRIEEARKAWESDPNKVKEAFDEEGERARFEYKPEEINQNQLQNQAAVLDYIRKLNDLSKSSQTEAEKKDEQRRKAQEDILAIEQSIAEIEKTMGDNATEESEVILDNMRKRLELAKEIARQLGYDKDKSDFYKQYGTGRQKQDAIRADYANQIAMAQAEGRGEYAIRSLEMRRDSDINKVILEELKSEVDWAGALNSFGGIMSDYAKRVYEKAKKLIDDPAFSKLSAEEQKSILDMFAEIRDNVTEKVDFASLGEKVSKYEQALENYQQVYDNNIKVIESATASEKDKEAAERQIQEAQAEVVKTQHEATYAINETVASIDLFRTGLEQLASGSLSGVYTGIQALGEALGKTPSKWGQIIAAILKLIDTLADKGIGPFINGILEAIEKVFDKLLDDITSGRLFEQVIEGVVKIIATLIKGIGKSLVNAFSNPINNLTGGGFINWDKHGNRESTKEKIDKWFDKNFFGRSGAFEKLSEETYKLSDASSTANDRILKDWNTKTAREAAKDAAEVQANNEKQIEAFRKLGKQWGQTGASITRHSQGYTWWHETLNSDNRKAFSDLGINGVNDLMNLTVDQYRDLQKNAAVWSLIDESLQEYINQIIKADDETKNVTDKTAEKFLNLSFDDMASNFLSTMMDIKSTAYDTADDISKVFYESMVTDVFNEKYRDRLKAVYDKMKAARESGNLTEIEGLMKDYQDIAKDFQQERNQIASDTGWAQSYAANQASSRGFQAMSQEVGNELNGRFTNLQISGEMIRADVETQNNELLPALSAKVESLMGLIGGSETNPISNIISQIQKTLNDSYLELQGINSNTGSILEFWNKRGELRAMLDEIRRNTSKIKG